MNNDTEHQLVIPVLALGDRLRVVRREYMGKITQAEMAAILGVPRERYVQWESGGHEPRSVDARRIALFLQGKTGVSAAWILGVQDSAAPGDGGGADFLQIMQYLGTALKSA